MPSIEIQIACDDDTIPDNDAMVRWVSRTLESAGAGPGGGVALRIVGSEEIQELNRNYREKNAPTNVLSFPAGTIEGLPESAEPPLGDIVVCAPVVREQALATGKPLRDHWAHMIVHGTLHLLGFDHETAGDAAKMEGLEARILKEQGIADPYAEA